MPGGPARSPPVTMSSLPSPLRSAAQTPSDVTSLAGATLWGFIVQVWDSRRRSSSVSIVGVSFVRTAGI